MHYQLLTTVKYSSVAIALAFAAQSAMASGYHFGTQSTSAQSTANASSAEAADAGTIFYNPAGLTKLEGTQVTGVMNLVAPSVKYRDAQAWYATNPQTGTQNEISGSTSGKITDDVIPVPHFYGSHQINDKVTVGLGVYVPFASSTEYDSDSVLRYNVNETKLTAVDVNPTVAYKINDKHSVAVGLLAQYSTAELKQYANFGAFGVGDGDLDGYAKIKGHDWGFGYNLGWMWDVNDDVRVGVSYRSKIKHTLKGTADWEMVNSDPLSTAAGSIIQKPVSQGGAGYADSDARVKIETPESLSVHGMWKVNPQWKLFGDVTWTKHSRFNDIDIEYVDSPKVVANAKNPTAGPDLANHTYLKPHWKDTFKFAVGASYQYSEPLQLRVGMAYDQSPVRNENERLSTMPDNDRIWFSVGAKYDINKQNTIDVGYSYLHIKNATANVNGWCGSSAPAGPGAQNCVSSRTNGTAKFKSNAQILGVQYTYRF